MNTSVILPDVQNLNREFLLAAHNALMHDYAAAGCIYHLGRELCARLLHASISEIDTLARSAGGVCLLTPVPNLIDLLDAPGEMVPAAAAVGMSLDFYRDRALKCASGEGHAAVERHTGYGTRSP